LSKTELSRLGDDLPAVDARPLDDVSVLVERCPYCRHAHYHHAPFRTGIVLTASCSKSHLPRRLRGKQLAVPRRSFAGLERHQDVCRTQSAKSEASPARVMAQALRRMDALMSDQPDCFDCAPVVPIWNHGHKRREAVR
jgi:hypothetical protein